MGAPSSVLINAILLINQLIAIYIQKIDEWAFPRKRLAERSSEPQTHQDSDDRKTKQQNIVPNAGYGTNHENSPLNAQC